MRFARVPDAREIARTFSIAGVISIVTSETSMLSAKTCTHPNLRLNVHTSPSRDRGSHILESALHGKVGHDLRGARARADYDSTCRARQRQPRASYPVLFRGERVGFGLRIGLLRASGRLGASAAHHSATGEHGERVTGTKTVFGAREATARAARSLLSRRPLVPAHDRCESAGGETRAGGVDLRCHLEGRSDFHKRGGQRSVGSKVRRRKA